MTSVSEQRERENRWMGVEGGRVTCVSVCETAFFLCEYNCALIGMNELHRLHAIFYSFGYAVKRYRKLPIEYTGLALM